MRTRRDHDTAKLIDTTITELRARGMYATARALYEAGVPFATARRVLVRPGQRRTYGAAALH
ncbi:hypothetical protein [Massilia sp. GCM10023247]|uniref:hypothetical protein n=1 Tax=Massilia sp. GCM10023247 TaxID=3252643 RepID=UPI00360F957B